MQVVIDKSHIDFLWCECNRLLGQATDVIKLTKCTISHNECMETWWEGRASVLTEIINELNEIRRSGVVIDDEVWDAAPREKELKDIDACTGRGK